MTGARICVEFVELDVVWDGGRPRHVGMWRFIEHWPLCGNGGAKKEYDTRLVANTAYAVLLLFTTTNFAAQYCSYEWEVLLFGK
jgi:hypothetical protein